ncbi:MAG: hypothetical protein AAF219_10125 [Myxococcota bacterium]
MRVRESACAAALLLGTALVGCDGTDCGSGTADEDGVCVAQCGAGTVLSGGECVSADVVCGPGTELLGNECSVAESACTAPAMFDMETQRCVSPAEVSCGAGTELDGDTCILSCEGRFEVRAADGTTCDVAARIQFFNASPDPDLTSIDIYSRETRIVDDLNFGEATSVLKIPTGNEITITLGASADNSAPVASVSNQQYEFGEEYFFVVRGVREPGDFVAGQGNDISLEVGVLEDLRESSPFEDETVWALLHTIPDAGPVSVGRQEAYGSSAPSEAFTNVTYGGNGSLEYSRPVDDGGTFVDVGTNPLDLYANGGGLPVASIQTSAGESIPASEGFLPGSRGILVAVGFANPSMNGDGPPAQVIAVLPDGTSAPLDEAARLQVVHASLDAPSSVDVYLGAMGATTVTDSADIAPGLTYQDATPFRSFVAGLPLMVQVTEAGSNTPAVNEPFTPDFGQTARLVAVGDPGDGSLTVDVVNGSEQSATIGTIDIQMYHASTSAPSSVDVYLSNAGNKDLAGPPDLSGLSFATETTALSDGAGDYIVSLTAPGVSTSVVDFTSTFTSLFELDAGESGFDGDSFAAIVVGDATSSATNLELVLVPPSGDTARVVGGLLP